MYQLPAIKWPKTCWKYKIQVQWSSGPKYCYLKFYILRKLWKTSLKKSCWDAFHLFMDFLCFSLELALLFKVMNLKKSETFCYFIPSSQLRAEYNPRTQTSSRTSERWFASPSLPPKHSNVPNIKYCNTRNYHVYAVTLLICSFLVALFHLILVEQFNYRGVNNVTDKHYGHS